MKGFRLNPHFSPEFLNNAGWNSEPTALIRIRILLQILGLFLLVLAGIMLIPLLYGLYLGDDPRPFVLSLTITAVSGIVLYLAARRTITNISQREGVLLVLVIWLASSIFGGLPFYLSPHFKSFTDVFRCLVLLQSIHSHKMPF